ncbi:MAG: enoyl-CoA hydratase, partial [Myxococcales bacterium]
MRGSAPITVQAQDAVGFVTIDRPESRGAMTRDMWLALPVRIEEAAAIAGVRAIVIRGTEGNFISGADIKEFEQLRSDPSLAREYDRGAESTLEALAALDVPSIAEIGGPCVGGGCLVASGCDLRVASDAASFGIPAGRLGLAYPYPALERIVAILGEARALELALTGRVIDAEEAARIGLVHTRTTVSDLTATVRKLTDAIAANAPLALRYL